MPRKFTFTTQVYDKKTDFPQTGDVDVIYIDASKNIAYRYDDSYYTISSAEVNIWGAMGSLSKGGGGGGGASWGSINGTLSNQTDLQTALDGKQDDLTLTTTGTSGAATLVGSTLNIPQYGGGSSAVTNLGIGTTGTNVTGTTANTITQSISIPANTLAANNTLDVLARFSKADNVGSGNYRMYINTSNSLTGATLVATLYTIAGGASIATHQNQRTFFYNGTNLTCNVGASFSSVTDIQQFVVTPFSMAYNAATNYFLIFAIQLSSATSSSVMTAYRILKYA